MVPRLDALQSPELDLTFLAAESEQDEAGTPWLAPWSCHLHAGHTFLGFNSATSLQQETRNGGSITPESNTEGDSAVSAASVPVPALPAGGAVLQCGEGGDMSGARLFTARLGTTTHPAAEWSTSEDWK